MSMPEATMDKNDGFELREYNIWLSRQALVMQTIPETESVQLFADEHLGAGVFAPDA